MPAPANLVHESSSSTGTGTFTLAAINGKQRFSDAFGTGGSDVFDYFISNQDASEWERGTGHMSDATTLVRDTVLESTNSDAAVNFSAGTKDVTNDVPADLQARFDTSGNLNPSSDDGGALGTTSLKWSDAFFASGAVINFASGDVTITHSAGLLTVSGDFDIGTDFFFDSTNGRLSLGGEENELTIGGSAIGSKYAAHLEDGSTAGYTAHSHGSTAGVLGGGVFYGSRSRGSEGSETVVQDGDFLASFAALGHDGTDYAQGARIDAVVDGTPGDGDMPTRINFRTSADGSESPTLRAALRADGSWQFEQGSVFVAEKNAADADKAGYGQWWVEDNTPNTPKFTDDGGNDNTLAYREPGINAQTGTSYTGVLADAGKVVTMDNASANTFTIPANSSVAYPTSTIINVIQKGAGTTTVAGDTGVTLNGVSAGSGDVGNQYGAVALIKIATDTWIASGNIGTVA